MTISFVGAVNGAAGAGTTTTGAIALPTYSAGDLLIASIVETSGSSAVLSEASGTWTQLGTQQNSGTVVGASVFYKFAAGSEASPTFNTNTSVSYIKWVIASFHTNAASIEIAAQDSSVNASAASVFCPGLTVSGEAELLLLCIQSASTPTLTTPAGWTTDASATKGGTTGIEQLFWKADSSTNPGSVTVTSDKTAVSIGWQIALKENAAITVALTGASANPAAGILSAKSILTVGLAGVSASAGIGALVATGGAAATLTGVAASPGVGSMSVSVRVSVTLQGVAANPAAGNLFTNGMFDQTLISSPDKPGQFLVEIVAYQGSSAASGGAEAIAEIPFSSFPPGSSVATGPVTLRYSDRDWIGEPTDGMQPNVFYEGRVVTPLMMDTQAPLYPENERRVQRQFGMIEILNSDGEFDSIIQALSVDGRAVTVRFGPYMGRYSDFAVVASMLGAAWQPGEDMITLAVQDQVYTLDLPVQSNLYGGGGGADGTSDIQGKPKPLCYGEVSNITPVFLDPLNLIYQIHDGPVQSVDAVYDRGGALTLDTGVGTGGDVADYAALVSATVGASQFATCLAQGLFKIGSSPAGVITVDAKGDKTGGTYSNQIDDIATWIFEDRSNISASLIDTASFTSAAALGGPIGLYVDQNQTPTASQVIDTILQSIGGWWGAEISGKIKAGRIRIPETTAPDFYFDKFDLLTIAPEQMPIPRWRQRVAYAQNYTVQRGEDLDVTVTDARRQFLIEPYAIVTSSSATLQIRHPIAQDPAVVPTLLVNQSDAQTVCDYLQLLYGAERQIIRVTTKRLGLTVNLGACVNLTYPRFGLDGGKNFIVIGRSLDMDKQEIELRLWG